MKKDLRIHPIRVWLTAEEHAQVSRFAERERLKISAAARRVVLLAAEAAEREADLEPAREA